MERQTSDNQDIPQICDVPLFDISKNQYRNLSITFANKSADCLIVSSDDNDDSDTGGIVLSPADLTQKNSPRVISLPKLDIEFSDLYTPEELKSWASGLSNDTGYQDTISQRDIQVICNTVSETDNELDQIGENVSQEIEPSECDSDNINVIINEISPITPPRRNRPLYTIISDSICKFIKIKNTDVQCVRGLDVNGLLDGIKSGLFSCDYKVILSHVGTNSVGQCSNIEFQEIFSQVVKAIRQKNSTAVIALSSILPMPKFGQAAEDIRVNWNKLLKELAFTLHVHYIPSDRKFLKANNLPRIELLAKDRWHLSRRGNSTLAVYYTGTLGRLQSFCAPSQ